MANINIGALSAATTAASALGDLILVTAQAVVGYQPQNFPVGNTSLTGAPQTFVFDYEGEQTLSLNSDITDHYVESNVAIEDQIALKPEVFTTHGFVGELNDVIPLNLKSLKTAAQKLSAVTAYGPQVSVTAELAFAQAFQLYQVAASFANSAVQAWGSLTNIASGGESVISANGITNQAAGQNKQQVAFQKFYGYWRERRLFTIQTPWAVFQNMAIQSLRAIQDDTTRMITDFEISFKMIRVAVLASAVQSLANSLTGGVKDGRAADAASSQKDNGANSAIPTDKTSAGSTNSIINPGQ